MAAAIAGVVVVSFVVMTGLAFFYTSNNEAFTRAKDLLLFINPVVGVVIGFYFNKTSTEARAESAEKTARVASDTAQQAVQERAEATAQATQATQIASQAEQKADEAVSLLGEVTESADAVLAQPQPGGGVLGGGGSEPEAAGAARKRLQEALERARRSGLLPPK
jgi:apolipoprotein N-acyltransferase